MPSECRSVLKSCLARFVRLDSCGGIVVGPSSKLTTKGYISVTATAQIETGEEFLVKNACGELCINEKDDDQFKRYDLELLLCQIDPELLELISSARLLVDGEGVTKGFAHGESTTVENFSLELWTKVTPADCSGEDPEWYWFAFPWVTNGMLTDITFENGPLQLTLTGSTRGAGDGWGRGLGPDCILPEDSPAESGDHMLAYLTTVQPPSPVCGLQAVGAGDLVCADVSP
jgi:hypothetical protein